MKTVVRTAARYKINQIQLYIEHTFAFRRHPDISQGSDALTAEEILKLDAYCRQYHVELVPSFSTFGHFYQTMRSPLKQHLNELEVDASQLPFSWWDRQLHYTLDCSNSESLDLVADLLREVKPLFSSNLFNICCDETFDLGNGKNKKKAESLGKGRLYVDFLKKVIGIVEELGCRPMFWGDIIGEYPELLREVSKKAIALDWCYEADLKSSRSPLFLKEKRDFYVCPGVHGWNQWINKMTEAHHNIVGFARQGLKDGAIGLLNTDWGDEGHINLLSNSYHGLILGGAASWNVNAKNLEPNAFDQAFSHLELGDKTKSAGNLLRRISDCNIVPWRSIALTHDSSLDIPRSWFSAKTGKLNLHETYQSRDLLRCYREIINLKGELEVISLQAKPQDPLIYEEMLCGLWGASLMIAIISQKAPHSKQVALRSQFNSHQVANEIRRFEVVFSNLWHRRNKPSEYFRIKSTLIAIANDLDRQYLQK